MSPFILNARIETDSFFVTNLNLCQIRLVNNQYFTWFLLIPRLNSVVNLTDLSFDNQYILIQELNQVATIIQKLFNPTRLNIASLGNIVPQMHWHIVARYDTDKAWPNPVWGFTSPCYEYSQEKHIITLFQNALLNKD